MKGVGRSPIATCLIGLDVYVVHMLSFFWEKTFAFSDSTSVLRAARLQFSLRFCDVLLQYLASLFGKEMLPPAGPDRFDPFYSSRKDSMIQAFKRLGQK